MLKKIRLPKIVNNGNIKLIKISLKNDSKILDELIGLYKNNKEHLLYWHHEWEELLFDNINDLKEHAKRNKVICYAIYFLNKITGCIEIGRLLNDEEKLNYRILTYWVDENYTRRGIAYNSLKLFEAIFYDQKLNYLITQVDIKNEPSINLMKKLGYKTFSISWQISENGETMCNFYSFKKTITDR
jgi:RimJ/RimL family protein N-acetyltransferase